MAHLTQRLLFLIILASISSISVRVQAACNAVDERALLAFKNGDPDRKTILSDWGKAGSSCCSWTGVTCNGATGRVTGIVLTSLNLRGQLSPELGALSELHTLNLFDNGMDGSIPAEFGKLKKLQTLNLGVNFFSDELPSTLSNLAPTLQVLDLSRYRFEDISPVIGKLVNLQTLVLSSSTTSSSGSIPSFIGNLKALNRLSLGSITSFTGSIPSYISKLTNLQALDLSTCLELTGSIPQSLSALQQLEHLDLSSTKISGSIPASLGKLSKLKHLSLSDTLISGSIPGALGQLTSLTTLAISRTRLTGSIPAELGSLKALKSMDLSQNPGMKGSIPATIGNLQHLQDLDLSGSGLGGEVPKSIGQLTGLVNLMISDNALTGSIPESMGLLSKLRTLFAHRNKLSGPIPEGLSRGLTSLETLQLSNNLITGLPRSMVNLRNLTAVDLEDNNLSFDTISGLATIPNLSSLSLDKCKLKGPIPGWLRNINMKPDAGALRISMAENEITGEIPAEFGKMTGLTSLFLQSNRFVGKIPDSFGNLRNLEFSDFSSNFLTGVPSDLRNLGVNVLYSFGLSNNSLSFNELKGLTTLSQVSILKLSHSQLKGPIPSWFLSIRMVQDAGDRSAAIDLSSNSVTGEIPNDIYKLTQVTQLSLNDNQLTGPIPSTIAKLTSLRALNLENNKLTGGIPPELNKLDRLEFFNVAGNKLRGQIPAGPPLSSQDPSSYANNPGLCGTPLPPC